MNPRQRQPLYGKLLVAAALCAASPAQSVLYSQRGAADDRLGRAVADLGDVDGDGVRDHAVGAPRDGITPAALGSVRVCSGRTGATLYTLRGAAPGNAFGHAGARPERARATRRDGSGAGVVYLFEGSNGATLFRFGGDFGDTDYGWTVRELGADADSDGYPDFLIGAPGGLTMIAHDLTGYVRVMSGHSGAILWMFYGTSTGARAGTSISSTSDYDGDGIRDVLVGMPGLSPSGSFSGAALVYSARTGAYLRSYPGGAALDRLGTLVAGLGDVDGDGIGDVALGQGRSSGPTITVRSGETGAVLFTVPRLTGDLTYYALEAAGDVDQDGRPDLLVGAANSWNASDRGVAHVVAGTRLMLTTDVHAVRVRTTDQQRFTLNAGAVHAGKPYLIVGSITGTSPGLFLGSFTLPLNYDFYFDLLASSPNSIIAGSLGALDASGNATASFTYANSMTNAMAGLVFHHAYVVFGPGFASLDAASNAVPLTALPRL
ncbi:MAG: FG-GAP repeat protein [Planctomycetes bacterium]|nr:FG-GAP repeat protein [Planctomycetota bacterium]